MSTYPPPQWVATPRPEPPQAIKTALTIVAAQVALSALSTLLV